MVSVMRFEVVTPARRWYKLCNHFTLYTDKLCSDVIKAYLFSSLSTHPLKSVEQRWKLGAELRGVERDIATYVIEVQHCAKCKCFTLSFE